MPWYGGQCWWIGFVLVSYLDFEDWFSKPVTQLNSVATRPIWYDLAN
jgi:hypothetical protein